MILYAGRKYVFVGAGASGKDFARSLAIKAGFKPDVGYTTRPKRDGEEDGITYNYITNEEFDRMVSENEFVQWNLFGNGHRYGTTKKSWENNDIFIIDPITIHNMGREAFRDRIIVYFNIPRSVRKQRLMARPDQNDLAERRLSTDDIDFINFTLWDVEISDPEFELGFA